MADPQVGEAALRAEHDALAKRLEVRASVDGLRRAGLMSFAGLVSACLSWGLVWDRFGKTPTEFALAHTELFRFGWIITALVALGLFGAGAVAFRRSRRVAAEEHTLFLRLCELRRALGIDP